MTDPISKEEDINLNNLYQTWEKDGVKLIDTKTAIKMAKDFKL